MQKIYEDNEMTNKKEKAIKTLLENYYKTLKGFFLRLFNRFFEKNNICDL